MDLVNHQHPGQRFADRPFKLIESDYPDGFAEYPPKVEPAREFAPPLIYEVRRGEN